ncbi:MAG TPA: hypothetical protein VFL94_00980 [Actinomycetales bacterium]|nr:hypothetical protein [Actinomycetales bacterium]
MEPIRRSAGTGLLVYAVGLVVEAALAGPGGDYKPADVASFVSAGSRVTEFATAYVGWFSALGLLVFAAGLRPRLPRHGDTFWALGVIATACAVVGWVLSRGITVAFAEGGPAVQHGVSGPLVYTLSEIANLVAVCAPAFCLGVMAWQLAAEAGLPRWLRVFSRAAGACGMLAAFYFPMPVYLLWLLVLGGWLVAQTPRVRQRAAKPVLPVA